MSDGEFQIPDELKSLFPQWNEEEIGRRITKYYSFPKQNMAAIGLITEERLEQKIKHGRSVKYDFENNGFGELIEAAVALIKGKITEMPEEWDQTTSNYMMRKPYQDRLVIAAALIAAEIDRLNYTII